MGSNVLLAGVCRRLSSSVVVCNAAGERVVRPPGAWAVGRPTLHGGPVRLRPVRTTPCCTYVTVCSFGFESLVGVLIYY